MPHFKTETYTNQNTAGEKLQVKVSIKVAASGDFYCKAPEELKHLFDTGEIRAKDFYSLEAAIKKALQTVLEVTITEELIIAYNIESHVSFAEDEAGNIYPNAGFPGASWQHNDIARNWYGGHHSSNRARGGYSLCVGAMALKKITHTYGEKSRVKYENYQGKGDHLQAKCPASLLNSWVSFNLPDNCKEMPYSDEAATFFHNLMLGMASLSRKIQEATFDQNNLQQLIQTSGNRLGFFGEKDGEQ